MNLKPNTGAIIMAFTSVKYLQMALICALELIRLNPYLKARIVTDFETLPPTFINFLAKQNIEIYIQKSNFKTPFENRNVKTRPDLFSPFQTTIYMDADILPVSDMLDLFEFNTDENAIYMVKEKKSKINTIGELKTDDGIETIKVYGNENYHIYNSGLVMFNKSKKTDDLFQIWHQEWLKFKVRDQLPLVRAIVKTGIKVIEIPGKFNFFLDRLWDEKPENITNLHIRGFYTIWEKTLDIYREKCPESFEIVNKILPF